MTDVKCFVAFFPGAAQPVARYETANPWVKLPKPPIVRELEVPEGIEARVQSLADVLTEDFNNAHERN